MVEAASKHIIIRVAILAAAALAVILFASSAIAAKPNNGTRPGWGYGDKNHVHTGPPGQTVRP